MPIKKKYLKNYLTFCFCAFFNLSAHAQKLDVTIYEHGGDGQVAECVLSKVAGLKAGGDGFLAVRTGPGTKFRKIDEIYNGDHVLVYDEQGPWLGVLYDRGQKILDSDTGVDSSALAKDHCPKVVKKVGFIVDG